MPGFTFTPQEIAERERMNHIATEQGRGEGFLGEMDTIILDALIGSIHRPVTEPRMPAARGATNKIVRAFFGIEQCHSSATTP